MRRPAKNDANTLGPNASAQLFRLAREWRQGEHVLVSGPTGSGKTALARHLYDIRYRAGGHCVVMVAKLKPDKTITEDYKGWTRWTEFRTKNVSPNDRRILLWPKVEGLPATEAVKIQREVFADAFDKLSMVGHWTVGIDEGLYTVNPQGLNLGQPLGIGYFMGRSADLTYITLTQRPSHLPVVLYGSASHVFAGQTREDTDVKRLTATDGGYNKKEMESKVRALGRHDFLWIPVAPAWEPEILNIRK